MSWTVELTSRASKQAQKLPEQILARLKALLVEMRSGGPIQPSMPHFGKLRGWPGEVYHCHLNKGRPTYVAVWQVKEKSVQLVEVFYVGTHENAPY